ncbi:cysteine protease domain, YopT-type, partial [Escherichia coli]|nr:cysteine protease domain, YopT-type [Escherichia coli]
DDIHSVSDEIYLPSYKINKKTQETVKKLSILLEHLHDKFSALMKSKIEPLVKVSLEDTEKGRFSIQINTENDKVQHFSIDASDIVNPFKKSAQIFYDVSGSGILDFELGMNITGIVQYTRILGQKAPVDALSHLNATLDIKQLAESTLGSMIQIAGERFFNHDGIQAFRLETWLANNLRRAASHSSVRLALALNSCARILELPVLESIAGVWGLYSSISELQQAKHHTEIMSARVRVAFDSISLSLTFASIAFPPLMIAVGPVAAIGMGAVSIAHNVASKEERHAQWLKCRQFLVDGSLNVATADPGTGIVDCSGNTVLGNMYLDLREKKPVLHGAPSFNSDLNIGNCPELNDWQIRQRIGYGYSFMPTSSLAQGYANTLWPNTIPSIPEGEYSTVILGYG